MTLDSGSDGLWDWNVTTSAIETHMQHWSVLAHPDDAERVTGRLRDRSPSACAS